MAVSEEAIRLKIRNKIYIPLTCGMRRKKLNFEDFTIISNNCWGGTVYESYGIKKMSPTVGMFIMPEDYLKLISNLRYYLEQPLDFISPSESKWEPVLNNKSNWGTYLIGKLEDIELQMLHHHDEAIARRKWEERILRINWSRLIFKFNDQNGATVNDIKNFLELPLENKLCFVASKQMKVNDDVILINQPSKYKVDGVKASREPFGHSRLIDITGYINNI